MELKHRVVVTKNLIRAVFNVIEELTEEEKEELAKDEKYAVIVSYFRRLLEDQIKL